MKVKLVNKIKEAKGTVSFFWEPEKEVKFLPGQYYYYTLSKLDFPDPRGETRHFTISSSPTEGKLLRLTTRIREESGYKKTLDALPIGSLVDGEGPQGTFILDEGEPGPHVFLAGGIGITPFRSMIKYAVDTKHSTKIYLIYSSSNSDEIAFKKELEEISKSNQNIKIKFIVTSKDGRLDAEKLKNILNDWKLDLGKPIFWVVGPPPMVDAMEEIFETLQIPSRQIRSEKFTGY